MSETMNWRGIYSGTIERERERNRVDCVLKEVNKKEKKIKGNLRRKRKLITSKDLKKRSLRRVQDEGISMGFFITTTFFSLSFASLPSFSITLSLSLSLSPSLSLPLSLFCCPFNPSLHHWTECSPEPCPFGMKTWHNFSSCLSSSLIEMEIWDEVELKWKRKDHLLSMTIIGATEEESVITRWEEGRMKVNPKQRGK